MLIPLDSNKHNNPTPTGAISCFPVCPCTNDTVLLGRVLRRVWRITRKSWSVCMCGQTGHRDIVHAGRRAGDGSWQKALPQPNFGLLDLDFLLFIPLEFQVVVTAQPKYIWLSVICRPVIIGSFSHQGLGRAQLDLGLAWWGSRGSNIFLFLLSSFF